MTGRAPLEALLLDFDGPLTDLMPAPFNLEAADAARAVINKSALPEAIAHSTDHLAILRFVHHHSKHQLPSVVAACTAAEIAAARISEPSPHTNDLFNFAKELSIPVAVVSNNDAHAARTFLDRLGLSGRVALYACRTPDRIDAMKPAPDLLRDAVTTLGVDSNRCAFIGDTVSDVIAGQAAGTPVIALAKDQQRHRDLLAAGPSAVVKLGDRTALIAELNAMPATDRAV
jgi:HAD superfamily hydrolase (TIGR01509 family)